MDVYRESRKIKFHFGPTFLKEQSVYPTLDLITLKKEPQLNSALTQNRMNSDYSDIVLHGREFAMQPSLV